MANEVEISVIAIDAATNILQKIGDQFGVLGQVAASALTFAAGGLEKLISAGSEAQDVQARFNSLVDASPLKDYKTQMLDMASALSRTTRFEDENIIAAEAQLSVYQNIGQKVFPDVLKATLNLATFMKSDATTAAQTLGRSFEDIAGGSLTMLYRQKLLTKEQKDQAEAFAKAGDSAKAQTYVLGILQDKIGNLSTDMAGTFSGRLEIFRNTLSNIAEDAGMKLLPAFEPVITKITQFAEDALPLVVNMIETYVLPALTGFIDLLTSLSSPAVIPQPLMDFFNLFGLWWQANGDSIIASGRQMFDALITGVNQLSADIAPFINEKLAQFASWFIENGPTIDAAIANIADFFSNTLVPAIVNAWELIRPILNLLGDMLGGLASIVLDILAGNWSKAWDDMKATVSKIVPDILNTLGPLVKVIEFLYSISPAALGAHLGSLLSSIPSGAGSFHNYGGTMTSKASGGWAGGLTSINEAGREMVQLPNGSYVHPAGESARMAGGNTIVFNFPNYIGSQSDLLSMIQSGVRQMQLEGKVPTS